MDLIRQMFFPHQKDNHRLLKEIVAVISFSLLVKTYDYHEDIAEIETKYKFDLSGLDIIIEDFRRWYFT